jgi:hypothetical protein
MVCGIQETLKLLQSLSGLVRPLYEPVWRLSTRCETGESCQVVDPDTIGVGATTPRGKFHGLFDIILCQITTNGNHVLANYVKRSIRCTGSSGRLHSRSQLLDRWYLYCDLSLRSL